MAKQRLVRRAPSGDVLRLEWEGAAPGSEVVGVRFAGGNYGRGFQIHPLGAHDAAVERFVQGARTSRLVVGRHEVKVSVAPDDSSTTATLIGRHHELMTVFTGPAPATGRIVDIFGVLDIDDAPQGMRVTPARSTLLSVLNEHLVVFAEDFVSMDMPGPAHAHRVVPRHRSNRTRRGNEVWKSTFPGRGRGRGRARDFAYIVGGRSGVAEVVASDVDATTDAAVLAMVDSLDVAWSPGS